MSRHARILSETNTYHVVIKGIDSQLLFLEDEDYIKYIRLIKKFKSQLDFDIFAYCLMSNHVHLLLRHSSNSSLSTIFLHLNSAYSVWFNQKYSRKGFLQGDRYYSEPIESENYLLNALHYIHYNPTKAGLEKNPGASYKWNSYNEYVNNCDDLVEIDFIFNILGSKQRFIGLHENFPKDTLFDIHKIKQHKNDGIATDIILKAINSDKLTDFKKLDIDSQKEKILHLYNEGVSIRQLNRLTGVSIGFINKAVKTVNS